MMKHDEFFDQFGAAKTTIQDGSSHNFTIEEMYQAFRSRMLKEVAQAVKVEVTTKVENGIKDAFPNDPYSMVLSGAADMVTCDGEHPANMICLDDECWQLQPDLEEPCNDCGRRDGTHAFRCKNRPYQFRNQ